MIRIQVLPITGLFFASFLTAALAGNCVVCGKDYPFCDCVDNVHTRQYVQLKLSRALEELDSNYPGLSDYVSNFLLSRELSLNLTYKLLLCFRCTILVDFLWQAFLGNNLEFILGNLIRYLDCIPIYSFEFCTYICSEKENLPP